MPRTHRDATHALRPAQLDAVTGGSEVTEPIMLVSGDRDSR